MTKDGIQWLTQNDLIEVSNRDLLTSHPRVSVIMITYNHAEYLAQAIQGVVSQVCDFPIELIIGEDASTDATRAIALTYQEKYPHIIRVVFSPTNVGMNDNWLRVSNKARGEFVAYCEGDDYWCSSSKLQRQVNLIGSNKSIGIVHTDWVRARLINGLWTIDLAKSVHKSVPLRLLQGDIFRTWYLPKVLRTCTILLRRETADEIIRSPLFKTRYQFIDNIFSAYITSRWRVAYIPDVTAVYRESPNSILRSGAKARVSFYKSCLEFDSNARIFFPDRSGYPIGYRWEADMALILWSVRARDFTSARFALRDLWKNFGPIGFVMEGLKSITMRLPSRRR